MAAPVPYAQGDINRYVLSEISSIKGTLGTMQGDLSAIKSYIENQTQAKTVKHSYMREITLLGISAGIATIISFLTGYRS